MELGIEPGESCSWVPAQVPAGWTRASYLLSAGDGRGQWWDAGARLEPHSRQHQPLTPSCHTPALCTPSLSCTFALPVGVRSEADVAAILAIELRHERLVGVTDEQDGGVEGLDLLLAALVRLDADGPAAAPVVPLAFEPWARGGKGVQHSEQGRPGVPPNRSPTPGGLGGAPALIQAPVHCFLYLLSTYYVSGIVLGDRDKVCKHIHGSRVFGSQTLQIVTLMNHGAAEEAWESGSGATIGTCQCLFLPGCGRVTRSGHWDEDRSGSL